MKEADETRDSSRDLGHAADGEFGALLRRYRVQAGLTQAELAERAGLSPDAVSTLERGTRRSPRRDTVRLLADGLGLTADERVTFEQAVHIAGRGVPERRDIQTPHLPPPSTRPATPRVRYRTIAISVGLAIAIIIGAALAIRGAPSVGRGSTVPAAAISTWSVQPPPAEPSAITVDAQGIVSVADARWNRIERFTASGRPLGPWDLAGSRMGPLRHPRGLASDNAGNLYVADTGNDRIVELSPSGHVLARWGHSGSGPGELHGPEGVAVGNDGTVYVADTLNGRVQAFTAVGAPISTWDASGSQAGKLLHPVKIAIFSSGSLAVADPGSGTIQTLGPDGAWANSMEGKSFISKPLGVAASGGDLLYVADTTGHVVQVGLDGISRQLWPAPGSTHQRVGRLQDVALDANNNAYVVDTAASRVDVLSPHGRLLRAWTVTPFRHQFGSSPQALALDAGRNMFVADAGNNLVVKLSPRGQWLAGWSKVSGSDALVQPGGIAVGAGGTVYVSDSGHSRVVKFSASGRPVRLWGKTGSGLGEFLQPAKVAVDHQGIVYVADSPLNRIERFRPDGMLLDVWYVQERPAPAGVHQFPAYVTGLAIDRSGFVYLTDSLNNVILKLSPNGAVLDQWGSSGGGPGQFKGPLGIAVGPSGRIYVADTGNNRVEMLSPQGRFVSVIGSHGTGAGQMDAPADVATDSTGSLYVADTGNGRIERFPSP